MWAWLRTTDAISRGANSGLSQFRSRSSLSPWNSPLSRSTCWPRCRTRYFDPVTVPAAPRNWRVGGPAMRSFLRTSIRHVADEHLIVRGPAGRHRARVGDPSAVGGDDPRLRPRGRLVACPWGQAFSPPRFRVGHADAVVHDVRDPATAGAPRERRRDRPSVPGHLRGL